MRTKTTGKLETQNMDTKLAAGSENQEKNT